MTKLNLPFFLAALLSLCPGPALAQKYFHTVRNPSFEANTLAPNTFSAGKPDSWKESADNGPDSFTEHIAGFNGHGVNHEGLAGQDYIYQDIVSRETDPAQIALDERPQAGRKYSLVVAVGNRPGWTQPGNISLIQLQLVDGANITPVAERRVDASTIPAGTFRTFNATYTATSNAPAGSKFRIWLRVISGDRAHFDDVQMISSVPYSVTDQHTQTPPYAQPSIPIMNSGAAFSKVLYLDFDGETNIPPMVEWNIGEPLPPLAHSGLSTFEIRRTYEVVKDDFSPFQINVTTDPSRYWSAPPGSRMRVIITPTDTWNYRELGIAQAGTEGQAPWRQWEFSIDSFGMNTAFSAFRDSGLRFHREIPVFVFVNEWSGAGFGNTCYNHGRYLGHFISHEAGHAFGLLHDGIPGFTYYVGQGPLVIFQNNNGGTTGNPLWAPIMGYAGLLTHWNKGEWNNAVNDGYPLQDDVAILASQLGYATDTNNSFASATPLTRDGSSFSASGIIGKTSTGADDVDYYSFNLPEPATVSIVCKPVEPFTDSDPIVQQNLNMGIASLFMQAELYRPDQSICCYGVRGASTPAVPDPSTSAEKLNPSEFLRVYLQRSLDAGTYRLKIVPSAYGNPATNGFSNHGNMGAYSFTGSIDWIEPLITSPLQATGIVNQLFSYTATSDQPQVIWSVSNLPSWLTFNASSGVLSGTPSTGGTWTIGLRVGNTATTSSEESLTITISVPAAPVITAPAAVTGEEGVFLSVPIIATGGATSYGYTGGAVAGISVNQSTGVISGTPTVPGNIGMTVTASNAWGTGSRTVSFTIAPAPGTALDSTQLAFTRPDAKKWFGQSTNTSDGFDAMQSPVLAHGESSTIETTVTGPGTISYFWKADTEAGDVLSFRIGGNVVDSVSGATGWIPREQAVPAGVQTLRWTFTRNASGDGGSNTVWLDRVNFAGATGPTITSPLTMHTTCGRLALVNLTADDPATVWTMGGTLPGGVFFLGNPTNIIGGSPWFPGTFTFTLFATNSLGTTTRAFTIYVKSSYTAWAEGNGLGAGSEPGDADKDGFNNFAELAFALNHSTRDVWQPVTYDPVTKRLRAVFKRRHQYYLDIKYEVQVSENLQTWTTIAEVTDGASVTNRGAQSVTETQVQPHPDPIQEVTVVDGVAQSPSKPKRWMRVKVSQQFAP